MPRSSLWLLQGISHSVLAFCVESLRPVYWPQAPFESVVPGNFSSSVEASHLVATGQPQLSGSNFDFSFHFCCSFEVPGFPTG